MTFRTKLTGASIGAATGGMAGFGFTLMGLALDTVNRQTGLAFFVFITVCSLAGVWPGIISGTNPKAILATIATMTTGAGIGALIGGLSHTGSFVPLHDGTVIGWCGGALIAAIVSKRLQVLRPEEICVATYSPPYRGASAMTTKPVKKAVFISYAWGNKSEEIANQVDQALQARGIMIVRDKRDAGFKVSIREFMEHLGQGKCVIVVISKKYLESKNCMFELIHIDKHGDFRDRIFPIVLDDANIYEPTNLLAYVRYWERKIAKLEEAIKRVSSANLPGIRDDIDLYVEIRAKLPRLTDILRDMNTLKTEIHIESGFNALITAIEDKLAE